MTRAKSLLDEDLIRFERFGEKYEITKENLFKQIQEEITFENSSNNGGIEKIVELEKSRKLYKSDANALIRGESIDNIVITVKRDKTIPILSVFTFEQVGAGRIQIVKDNVSIASFEGGYFTAGQGAMFQLTKVGVAQYTLTGGVEE